MSETAREIAKALFTDGRGKHHYHLSLDTASALGWSEAAVAGVIERGLESSNATLRRERDEAQERIRNEWAMNHGCPTGSIYGDDGELSCAACRTDFRRMPFEELEKQVFVLRSRSLDNQLKLWEQWRDRALKAEAACAEMKARAPEASKIPRNKKGEKKLLVEQVPKVGLSERY